jgi:xanthine dehydrogenase accessory factor
MDDKLFQVLSEAFQGREEGVLCTVVEEIGSTPRSIGAKMWVRSDGSTVGTIGGGITEHRVITRALALLREGGERELYRETLDATEAALDGAACGGSMAVYLEVMGRENEVLIFGAGHVGKAIARFASFAGFRLTVWDEREEFANAENIPWGRTLACPLDEVEARGVRFTSRTYAVIVTRGHALDAEVVRLLDGKPLAYVGMIGSRRKIAFVRKRLLESGVSREHLDRIYQPIGLPIKAETPEEIAVSVLAEIIAVRRGANLPGLRAALEPLPKQASDGEDLPPSPEKGA